MLNELFEMEDETNNIVDVVFCNELNEIHSNIIKLYRSSNNCSSDDLFNLENDFILTLRKIIERSYRNGLIKGVRIAECHTQSCCKNNCNI